MRDGMQLSAIYCRALKTDFAIELFVECGRRTTPVFRVFVKHTGCVHSRENTVHVIRMTAAIFASHRHTGGFLLIDTSRHFRPQLLNGLDTTTVCLHAECSASVYAKSASRKWMCNIGSLCTPELDEQTNAATNRSRSQVVWPIVLRHSRLSSN